MSRKANVPVVNSDTITLGERVGNDKHRSVVWRLHCQCGASFDVPAPCIKRGYFRCEACNPKDMKAAVLAAMPGTHTAIMQKTGFSRDSVKHHLATLRDDANKKCYVGKWVPCKENSQPIPVFYLGNLPDVPAPAKKGTAIYSRRYRRNIRRAIEKAKKGEAYKMQYAKHVSRALADDFVKQTRKKPQGWLAALGL